MAYIACEDIDFVWSEKNLIVFRQMWKEGLCIVDIAKAFRRDTDDVALLVMDQKRKGHITERPGGAWGRRMPDAEAERWRNLSTGCESGEGEERN